MKLTLDTIKEWYRITILQFFQGEAVVREGKCSQWIRRKELSQDKDLIYLHIQIHYEGPCEKNILYTDFYLEDADGYFNKGMPSEDYLDQALKPGNIVKGGLLFSLYQDISPMLLWFDTGILYENSKDPILLDLALPLANSHTRTQILAKEKLAKSYSRQVESQSQKDGLGEATIEAFLQTLSQKLSCTYKKNEGGYIFRIPLPEKRKQNIILHFTDKGALGPFLSIGTICALAHDGKNDRTFLKLNPKMTYGSIGITKIQGEDYYIITENLPFSLHHYELIVEAIRYIAAKGDWLEMRLTDGMDIQ